MGARRPFTSPSDFQARRLYEWAGYELVGRVPEDFPSGADVLWYRSADPAGSPAKPARLAVATEHLLAIETCPALMRAARSTGFG